MQFRQGGIALILAWKDTMSAAKLLLAGDSYIDFFDWQKRFPEKTIAAFGVPGETVEGLLGRVPAIIKKVPNAERVLLMTGTNNIGMEDYNFLPAYGKIIDAIHDVNSQAMVTVNSLFPVQLPWLSPDAIPRLNVALRHFAEEREVQYLEGYNLLVDEKGSPRRECFLMDNVHLSAEGYAVWSEAVARHFGWV
jgi:lysophospholipase L1-like esterase